MGIGGNKKRVEIVIDAEGNVELEAFNFKGQGCAEATKQIEIVLGGGNASTDKKRKPEFSQQSTGNQQRSGF